MPMGPLKLLVRTAKDRNEQLTPALIYNSSAYILTANNSNPEATSKEAIETGSEAKPVNVEKTKSAFRTFSSAALMGSGIKLGLGDFIFYSLLLGRSSLSVEDHFITIGCLISILIGLTGTLTLLSIYKRALPALLFSVLAGITFHWTMVIGE